MLPLKPDLTAARDNAVRSLVRAAIATGVATLDKGTTTARHAAKTWPEDADVPLLLKASTLPLAREDAPALAAVASAFLQALVPMSAAADLFARSLGLSFGPGASSFAVPRMALPSAAFVKELGPIPVVDGGPASLATLVPHKIKVIVLATSELLHNANAEAMLRQMMVESTGPALDAALFSASAATPELSAGLLSGITPLASTGNLNDDLIKVLSAIAPVAGNGNVAIVASADRAAAINLLPRMVYPVLTSAVLPSGTLIAIALAGVVSAAEGAPVIGASTQAVVHMETAPATDIGGGAARPVRSVFQTDCVALRLTWGLDWALRDPRAVAWIQG